MKLENQLNNLKESIPLDFEKVEDSETKYQVSFQNGTLILVEKLDPGLSFLTRIASLPEVRKEDFLMKIMEANFLGQGTGGAVIALEPNEKFLTLFLLIPYEVNDKEMHENLEDFLNYLAYWKEEVHRWEETEQTIM